MGGSQIKSSDFSVTCWIYFAGVEHESDTDDNDSDSGPGTVDETPTRYTNHLTLMQLIFWHIFAIISMPKSLIINKYTNFKVVYDRAFEVFLIF